MPVTINLANSYRRAVLADAPRAYWRVGEGAATVDDETGESPDGVYVGAPALDQPGAVRGGRSALFDATAGRRITIGDVLDFPGFAPFAIECFVRPTEIGVGRRIVSKEITDGGGNQGAILAINTAGTFSLLRRRDSVNESISSAPDVLTTTSWHHVVGVFDGVYYHLFRNGLAVAAPMLATTSLLDNAAVLTIGGTPTGTALLKAYLAEVAIYDYAPAPERWAAHYAAALPIGPRALAVVAAARTRAELGASRTDAVVS